MFLVNRSIEEIQSLIDEHKKAPEKRLLQKTLAHDVTSMVHGEDAFNKAVAASNILFGKSSTEDLENLDSSTFNAIMRDVPKVDTKIEDVNGTPILDFLCDVVKLGSKTELRKLITSGAISINKNKIADSKLTISPTMLLSNNTMLIQKGKKKHVLVRV
jgi:tyrosyl-tRNA synthetase